MKTSVAWLTLVSGILLSGCTAPVGVTGVKVPESAGAECAEHCATINMRLSAVAIMANNVGCVCQPAPQTADANDYQASTTAGMATIVMQERAQEQQQHQQQQTQMHQHQGY